MTPTGSPSTLQCSGTDIAGAPVRLKMGVYGIQSKSVFAISSAALRMSGPERKRARTSICETSDFVRASSPMRTGGAATVGISSTS